MVIDDENSSGRWHRLTHGPGRRFLRRSRLGICTADPTAAAADLEAAKAASESMRGVHRLFEEALLGLAQTELLILQGDLVSGAAHSETARITFERGSHAVWASTAGLLTARCLAHTDATSADRLAHDVESFARDRGLLALQVNALTLRGLLAGDLAKLEEAGKLAERIGSLWTLASIAHVRYRIFRGRHDEKDQAREHKAFLSHLSILSSEVDAPTRARLLAAAERSLHPFLI